MSVLVDAVFGGANPTHFQTNVTALNVPIQAAFDHVANFQNSINWSIDPVNPPFPNIAPEYKQCNHIKVANNGYKLGVGAQFQTAASSKGIAIFTITEFKFPTRVALSKSGNTLASYSSDPLASSDPDTYIFDFQATSPTTCTVQIKLVGRLRDWIGKSAMQSYFTSKFHQVSGLFKTSVEGALAQREAQSGLSLSPPVVVAHESPPVYADHQQAQVYPDLSPDANSINMSLLKNDQQVSV